MPNHDLPGLHSKSSDGYAAPARNISILHSSIWGQNRTILTTYFAVASANLILSISSAKDILGLVSHNVS